MFSRASFRSLFFSITVACVSWGACSEIAFGQTPASASQGDFAGLVDIDHGRHLYLECHGAGTPTVILESGFRNTGAIWTISDHPNTNPVLAQVSEFTHVCVYDRPGTTLSDNQFSRSDPVPMPRTITSIVHDLHALLTAAGIPGPYVLAAHSLGGIMARVYTAAYPYSIVGLVLVDSYPERLETFLGRADTSLFEQLVVAVPKAFQGYAGFENIDLPHALAQMRNADTAEPLRPLPLYVLARGRPIALPLSSLPPDFSFKLEAAWRQGQDQLATLLPDARYRIAKKSEHYIQVEQPDLVVKAIREVWMAARTGRWTKQYK
jgi:pimeloyl-ACP methyl ester carboxylesterase